MCVPGWQTSMSGGAIAPMAAASRWAMTAYVCGPTSAASERQGTSTQPRNREWAALNNVRRGWWPLDD